MNRPPGSLWAALIRREAVEIRRRLKLSWLFRFHPEECHEFPLNPEELLYFCHLVVIIMEGLTLLLEEGLGVFERA